MKRFLVEVTIKSSLLVLISLGILLAWSNLSNLPLINAVGSLGLNTATPSALPKQATPSVGINQTNTQGNKALRTFKVDPTGKFIEDELIVKFKTKSIGIVEQQNILSAYGAGFNRDDSDFGGAKVIKVPPGAREQLMEFLKGNSNVEYVEPNLVVQMLEGSGGGGGGGGTPSCFLQANDFYLCNGDYQWALKDLRAPTAWMFEKGTSNIAIAIVDSGVDYNHYDLGVAPSGKVIKGRDLYNPFEYPNDPMDENGHGTSVAGIAGAMTNNTWGIAGAGYYTEIVAIKVSGTSIVTTADLLAKGIREAVNEHPEVKVINLSIGLVENEDLPSLRSAVQYAQSKGAVIVAGVKNSPRGSYNCFQGFPAAYSGVISVVAIDRNGQHASGCTGRTLNGKNYENIWVSTYGDQIFSLFKNGGQGYLSGPATSWATPFVSGLAALLSNHPGSCSLSASQVKMAIKYGTDDQGTPGWDMKYGQGSVNFWKALDYYNCF